MSIRIAGPGGSSRHSTRRVFTRGQSLVEFVLVFPLLLVLLLTVADFGRLFAVGITIESAARAAAELAASQYMFEPSPVSSAGYDRLHEFAYRTVCDEASALPNATPATSGECGGLPTIVCVHDGADPGCSNVYNVGGTIPAGCGSFDAGLRPTPAQTGGAETSRYVEVRVCYRFTTLFQLTFPGVGITFSPLGGEFIIERNRAFTVADY